MQVFVQIKRLQRRKCFLLECNQVCNSIDSIMNKVVKRWLVGEKIIVVVVRNYSIRTNGNFFHRMKLFVNSVFIIGEAQLVSPDDCVVYSRENIKPSLIL